MKHTNELLILRPDNIGDVVLFSGCLEHIRRIYPDCRITLAVQPHIINLVELCPWVDRVVAIKVRRRRGTLWSCFVRVMTMGFDRWRSSLASAYDKVIFPIKSPDPDQLVLLRNHAAPFVFGMIGCQVNAPPGGYPDALAPANLCSHVLDVSDQMPRQHELKTNLAFLEFLGCPAVSIEEIAPKVWLSDADLAFARQKIAVPGPVIGIFPCASDSRRNWHKNNYALWAQKMDSPGTFVIFGSSHDMETTSELAVSLKTACPTATVVNLAGTTLRQLMACISLCDLLLSVDSAGLQLGIAAGIPTVGILGGWFYGRFAPWGDPNRNRIMTNHLPCFGCYMKCTRAFYECLHSIRPDDVAACCNELLCATHRQQPLFAGSEKQCENLIAADVQRR